MKLPIMTVATLNPKPKISHVIAHFKQCKTGKYPWSEHYRNGATEIDTVEHKRTVQDTIDRIIKLKFVDVTHTYNKEVYFDLIRRRTDILLEGSEFSVAIECQISYITPKKLLERTQDYLSNNLDVIWIFKHHSIVSKKQEKLFQKLVMFSSELKKSVLRFTFNGIGDGILILNIKNDGYRGTDLFNEIELIDPKVYNLGYLLQAQKLTQAQADIHHAKINIIFKEIDKLNLDYRPLNIKGYEGWFYYKKYPSNDTRFKPEMKFITSEGEFKDNLDEVLC